jgi:hypothetical protein
MYTQEQFQQSMQKAMENQKTYTEDSIDQARTKWQDARELVQHIESGGRSIYRVDEARRAEEDAHKELDDALKYAGPLAARKRARELAAKREQEHHTEQVEHAATEKAAFLASAKARWLAAGGSEHQFSEQFETLWTDEVRRRVQQEPTEVERVKQKLRATGQYSI